jgi:hypothetical protein
LVEEVGQLRHKYIIFFKNWVKPFSIGSYYMAHVFEYEMWPKDFLYILFKMRMENKAYGINFGGGI